MRALLTLNFSLLRLPVLVRVPALTHHVMYGLQVGGPTLVALLPGVCRGLTDLRQALFDLFVVHEYISLNRATAPPAFARNNRDGGINEQ